MSQRIRRIIAVLLLLVTVVGLLPTMPVSAATDTAAVGKMVDSYAANSSVFTLNGNSRFFVEGNSAPDGELLQTVQLLQQEFAADGRPSATPMAIVWGPESWIHSGDIVIKQDTAIAAEGYKLEVTEYATITVSDMNGLIYGGNMLLKHLRYAGSNSIQGFAAADAPDTVQRAVSLDCGRKYYSKNWICNFIREMSWMGYNTLELHFSDDSGFRLDIWDEAYYTDNYRPANDFTWLCGSNYTSWTLSAYKNDPDKGKYLTTAEVVEILETAAQYHIEVIPAFDSPSHLDYTTWMYEQNYKSNPGYSFYSTYDNKTYYAKDVKGCINYTNSTGWSTALKWPYYSTIDIVDAHAKAFVFELYIDIANFFKEYAGSTDISIGADEVNLSKSNLASGYSFTWGFPDFVDYINELNALVNDMGYTMRMYNDFMGSTTYKASNYDFADNIEILYWDSPFEPNSGTKTAHTEPVSYYVNQGRVLYNCIQTNTYYALRITNGGSDARSIYNRMWTFYHANEEDIYDEWYSADISEHGDYSENVADVPAANLGGAYFLIWCDYNCVSTEQEIWNGVYDKTTQKTGEFYSLRDRMWSNITKMWNWDINNSLSFSNFKKVRDAYGDCPGIGTTTTACSEKTVLPTATEAVCGHIFEEATNVEGDVYTYEIIPGDCVNYERVLYSCSLCGDSYTDYADTVMSDWQETKPEGVDESLIETKVQYRYSDYETTTSYETSLEGYEQLSSAWVQSGTGSVQYVNSWPSGFYTGNSLYTKYNNKSSKVTASETATTKTVIDSDKVSGYLYYHWCYYNSYYSKSYKTGSYTTFHAYYSTTAPGNYTCDYSDYSYKTSHSTCSTNSDWFFVAYVYTQKYTNYNKQFTYGRQGDWSEWSDTPVTAGDTRQVETRTVYRVPAGELAPHSWEGGSCTEVRSCTVCGTTESEPVGHSYEAVVTPPGCTEDGYTTYTCTACGDSYTADTVAADGHSYEAEVVPPTCTEVGYTSYTCVTCGNGYTADEVAANGHSYEKGVCTVCGEADPNYVAKPTITPQYPSLIFEEEVHINVYFTVSDMTNVVSMGLVVSEDATVDENDTMVTEYDYKVSGDMYGVRTHGIPAKKLGDTVYFKIYAKLTDGSYVYSGVYNYSALEYAEDRLANSANEDLKRLCVAMLNYGSAAQVHMNHNVENLANSTLTETQLAMVEAYNSSMVADVTAVDSNKIGIFARSGFGICYPSVTFEGAFSIGYYFKPSNTPENGMKLYYWDLNTYATVDKLTKENATGVVDMVGSGTSLYKGSVTGIAAKEIDETLFVAGVYEIDGVTYATGVLPYSLGAYCVDRAANGSETMQELAAATAVYGYYAEVYFANN